MDAHVLVTGGAGFIGSHLVDALLRSGARVTVLDRLTYAGSLANLAEHEGEPKFRFERGDVVDPATVGPLVRGADRVIHAAAETHVDRSIAGPAEFVMTNVVGTQVVLDTCREFETPVLVVSTDEVYGQNVAGATFDEDAPLRPRSPYAASKAGAELLARSYAVTYGAPVSVVRGTNAYGPRQNPEKAIPVFALAALAGEPLPVFADGRHSREWLYVTDWVSGCLTALAHGEPGEAFNIGGGFELTNLELARKVCELAGADPSLISSVPDRAAHDLRYGITSDRLRELGWIAEVSFDDGLARTVEWYRANPEWVEAMRAGAAT